MLPNLIQSLVGIDCFLVEPLRGAFAILKAYSIKRLLVSTTSQLPGITRNASYLESFWSPRLAHAAAARLMAPGGTSQPVPLSLIALQLCGTQARWVIWIDVSVSTCRTTSC